MERNTLHGAAVKKLVSQCDRERELRDMICVAAFWHKGMLVVCGGMMAYNGSHKRECSVVDLE